MPPSDHVRAVLLGACWTGLEAHNAAEDLGGLASILLLKGVQAVLAEVGLVPVNLLSCLADAVVAADPAVGLARQARSVLLDRRDALKREVTSTPVHPVRWASVAFYGVPWASELEPAARS